MNIIDAHWEKESLGLNVAEIIFEKDNSILDYNKLNLDKFDYIVVKVPAGNNRLVHDLEQHGFRYLENTLTLQKKISTLKYLPGIYSSLRKSYWYERLRGQSDLLLLLNEVQRQIFTHDRISCDPKFTAVQSSARYVNWIRSIHKKGECEIYFIIDRDNGEKCGFFILNPLDSKKYVQLLAGLFNASKNTGIGLLTVLFPLIICQDKGIKTLETYVSSNNLDIINIHSKIFSYELSNVQVVLRKFNSQA